MLCTCQHWPVMLYNNRASQWTYTLTPIGGQSGVFDASELVTVLREENGRDICVIAVPKVMNYVDHVVLVTGRSTRHLRALAEYVRWLVGVLMWGKGQMRSTSSYDLLFSPRAAQSLWNSLPFRSVGNIYNFAIIWRLIFNHGFAA